MAENSEFDASGSVRPTRFIRIKEVQYRTGLGRATIYRWVAKGQVHKPIRLGGHAVAWVEAELESWLASRIS